jgi:hypothetical protein
MWYACERREIRRYWWESPREGDHSEDRGVNGRMALEWILWRLDWGGGGRGSVGSG